MSTVIHHIENDFAIYNGDTVAITPTLPKEFADIIVFSPPFPGMYAYTDKPEDMGNCSTFDEMLEHYSFLIPHLFNALKPGRSCCVHLTQGVAFKHRDGFSGMRDFRGRVIAAHESAGFRYYGEVCIDKDPQVKAIRTKDAGLLFKSLATDSARMHMAMADYILQFRKPGDNAVPIRAGISEKYNNPDGWITADEWIEWAAPVWYRHSPHYPGGIRETDVLNTSAAKGADDEKHICPLQLGVIERCVKLWSAPGETVFSPFAGIGSEGYQSILLNRRFVGVELNSLYYQNAIRNMQRAVASRKSDQQTIFDFAGEDTA